MLEEWKINSDLYGYNCRGIGGGRGCEVRCGYRIVCFGENLQWREARDNGNVIRMLLWKSSLCYVIGLWMEKMHGHPSIPNSWGMIKLFSICDDIWMLGFGQRYIYLLFRSLFIWHLGWRMNDTYSDSSSSVTLCRIVVLSTWDLAHQAERRLFSTLRAPETNLSHLSVFHLVDMLLSTPATFMRLVASCMLAGWLP